MSVKFLASKIHMPTPLDFDTFFYMVNDKHKKSMLSNDGSAPTTGLILYHKENQTMNFLIPATETQQDAKNVVPILGRMIWDANPDYYAVVSECWIADYGNTTLESRVNETHGRYEHGTISALPSEDKTEGLLIVGRTMDNKQNCTKTYGIVRAIRNDESSKVLELKDMQRSGKREAEVLYDRMFDFGGGGDFMTFRPSPK